MMAQAPLIKKFVVKDESGQVNSTHVFTYDEAGQISTYTRITPYGNTTKSFYYDMYPGAQVHGAPFLHLNHPKTPSQVHRTPFLHLNRP